MYLHPRSKKKKNTRPCLLLSTYLQDSELEAAESWGVRNPEGRKIHLRHWYRTRGLEAAESWGVRNPEGRKIRPRHWTLDKSLVR